MTLYHTSDSLQLGDLLDGDYFQLGDLIAPFFRALDRSEDCFYAMLMHADYMSHVLYRNNIRDWINCAKYATEAIFEYVRYTRFPDCNSRVISNYFYDDLDHCRRFYADTWGNALDEVKARVHLYEIEVDQTTLEKRDVRIYDIAYDAMRERTDFKLAMECANRYFSGEATDDPLWEYLSEAPAKAVRDVTALLQEN